VSIGFASVLNETPTNVFEESLADSLLKNSFSDELLGDENAKSIDDESLTIGDDDDSK
jgi:hypothetical protein